MLIKHRNRIRRRPPRGFTLIELLIALMAGLLVATAAFSFSKQSSRFFAQEARVAGAQMAVVSGFQRLQSDLSRASYMSTPNLVRDKDLGRICAPEWAAFPATLQRLAGIQVNLGGSHGAPQVRAMPDGNYPDSVRLTGSFSSTESFPVRTVLVDAGGTTAVYLQVNNGPMTRSGFTDPGGGDLASVFAPGRILRVVDQHGHQEYAVIQAASYPAGGQPVIVTRHSLPLKGEITAGAADTASCGIDGLGIGVQANVVNVIEYGIANLSGANRAYDQTIYAPSATVPGDESRTELVRREIFITDQEPVDFYQDPNAEVVAEYAVDLRFGLWVTDPGQTQGLRYIAPSAADITNRMRIDSSYAAGVPPSGPESVRSVEARLVVRSREVDRSQNLDTSDVAADGGFIFRYGLPNNGGFARARTLVADVTLHNQRGDAW